MDLFELMWNKEFENKTVLWIHMENKIITVVKHIEIPLEYKFSIKIHIHESQLLCDLNNYENISDILSMNSHYYAIPKTGKHLFLDVIDCFVYNQEKQGFMTLYFLSKADYETLLQIIETKKSNLIKLEIAQKTV